MISVTETASEQIQKLLASQHPEAKGLRVGVKAGGCSGFEYVFAWEAEPREQELGPGKSYAPAGGKSHGITLELLVSLAGAGRPELVAPHHSTTTGPNYAAPN